MKTLYLIRHAKSRKDIPGIRDEDRPLHERGQKQAAYIGRCLKKLGLDAQAAYASPAKRAMDTAKIIAKKTGFPRRKIQADKAIYYSSVPRLMKLIKSIDDKAGSALVFGHNPEFLDLLNYLVPGRREEFPTGAVCGIGFDAGSWRLVGRRKGRLILWIVP